MRRSGAPLSLFLFFSCSLTATGLGAGVAACERAAVVTPREERAPDAATIVPARLVDAAPSATEPDATPDAEPDVAAPSASARPAPIGGTWVTCYGRFRPTSTPGRDLLRLGLLCGPVNGMKQLGPVLEGEATEGGAEHGFDATAGECFRLFAVADAAVGALGVELRDPKGFPLAADHGADRWPVVNPDGPICVMDDGRYTVRVRAKSGAGRYALGIWKLPAAK